MKDVIFKHSLINAIEHEGKANVGAVLGKIIAENSSVKQKIKEILPEIEKTVEEINSLSLEEQKNRFNELGIVVEKKETHSGLPELPDAVKDKVVMRIAPFPSGPLHIGNARTIIVNDEYVKKFKGKLLLIIDDTIGSEEKQIIPAAYKMIQDGIKWLNVNYNKKIIYKSDRLETYYEYAEKIIKKGKAYVCTCSAKKLRENRVAKKECDHREQTSKQTLEAWRKMFKMKEGQAVLRIKTDMKHPNPAFRDRVLFRICERTHPRVKKKYKVWPLLEFSWAIDDYLLGITHIIRGKELMIETEMEKFIFDIFGWKYPVFIHMGLLQFEGIKISKSKGQKEIREGRYSGWDDPRTWSLQSLKKRGIRSDAIRKFIVDLGLNQNEITVPIDVLYAENRKIIDSVANRYFAVFNPEKISVDTKIKSTMTNLHPEFPKKGKKVIPVNPNSIYIEKEDLRNFDGREIGLMNLFSVKLGKKSKITSKDVKYEIQKIHWVSEPNIKIKVVMPDEKIKSGLAEPNIKKLKVGDVIQLQRFGFCRVDKTGKETVLYFAHK
jgi:glutamyl-tRNA synthetase